MVVVEERVAGEEKKQTSVDTVAKILEAFSQMGNLGGTLSQLEGGRKVGTGLEGLEDVDEDLRFVYYMSVY